MGSNNKRYLLYIAQNYSYAILRPLQQAIRARGDEVCWFLEGNEVDPLFLKPTEKHLLSIEEVKAWQPDAVLVPGNVVPNFIPGIKVGVFHGFNAGKMNHKGREDHFEIRDCFDLYCTQGPATTQPFLRLAEKFGTFKVVETGWPTLDPMFRRDLENPYRIDGDTRPVILFCSTFSRSLSCASIIYEQIKVMSKQGNWRWLVQFHPKMSQDIVDKYKALENENLKFVETDNVLPLLKAADVMLCDTSSILIMFLLLGKPVVTFKNHTNSSHLVNVEQLGAIQPALEQALSRPSELMAKIGDYCDDIHPCRDGHSSERVLLAVDDLIESGISGLVSKPMNLLRHFKMRRKLGYWKV
ncbi:CDP-glycerol:poly(Glycerophosphate) glycerophosphotransferase [Shewanella benthica]|uniref:CDP-glycerol:poly(Glycerophosphate) glycerophosphotransferase n=1 Tax=Shewanella benthica TaxID=43661 RepID=A0A330LYL5_9GAMM|nr:CDP-glycerol glycerophosphotransferase family protein [Shewanella benthica]SQH74668.1 CDP-glycerol:poly(Glycerophosphate) glycerophosphotransferase [Shewanella benthica]